MYHTSLCTGSPAVRLDSQARPAHVGASSLLDANVPHVMQVLQQARRTLRGAYCRKSSYGGGTRGWRDRAFKAVDAASVVCASAQTERPGRP